jgi:hypothetical protein
MAKDEVLDETPQGALFDLEPKWKDHWQGMPGWDHKNISPWRTINVHFRNLEDYQAFAKLIGTTLGPNTKSTWYPKADIAHARDRAFTAAGGRVVPKYPVYVISKGRWEKRYTARQLDKIGVPYRIVIEPQEFAQYASVIPKEKILTLPFSNLGQGSIPARNWVWEHAISEGHARHWILDDNIYGFYRMQYNLKTPVADGAIFCAAEDFTDRYENVALSGFQYYMFMPRREAHKRAPTTLNTRIYSTILIQNDLPYRWRGRYNEDTDLSIRALKDGWCTVLFNAFLQDKATTMTTKGGNTEELYKIKDGRLLMAESLRDQHPDVCTITNRWGRPQHLVDYTGFRANALKLKPGVEILEGSSNDFGMELKFHDEDDDAPVAESPERDEAAIEARDAVEVAALEVAETTSDEEAEVVEEAVAEDATVAAQEALIPMEAPKPDPLAKFKPTVCRKCGDPIRWVLGLESGSWMALDLAPVADGAWAIEETNAGPALIDWRSATQDLFGEPLRYWSHWSTCADVKAATNEISATRNNYKGRGPGRSPDEVKK